MTLWQEINEIPGSKRQLREFGMTLGILFGLLAGFMFWRGKAPAVYFAGASAFFLFFGTFLPGPLKPVQKVWMALALVMGWVMSRVILVALFFLVVTPVGLIVRLSGKDLLGIRTDAEKDSYWSAHRQMSKEDYENQF